MNAPTSTPERLQALLADLPPEHLKLAELFIEFLLDQSRRGYSVKLVTTESAWSHGEPDLS